MCGYYSCAECGEAGAQTFEYGEPNGHEYDESVLAYDDDVKLYTVHAAAVRDLHFVQTAFRKLERILYAVADLVYFAERVSERTLRLTTATRYCASATGRAAIIFSYWTRVLFTPSQPVFSVNVAVFCSSPFTKSFMNESGVALDG